MVESSTTELGSSTLQKGIIQGMSLYSSHDVILVMGLQERNINIYGHYRNGWLGGHRK